MYPPIYLQFMYLSVPSVYICFSIFRSLSSQLSVSGYPFMCLFVDFFLSSFLSFYFCTYFTCNYFSLLSWSASFYLSIRSLCFSFLLSFWSIELVEIIEPTTSADQSIKQPINKTHYSFGRTYHATNASIRFYLLIFFIYKSIFASIYLCSFLSIYIFVSICFLLFFRSNYLSSTFRYMFSWGLCGFVFVCSRSFFSSQPVPALLALNVGLLPCLF